MYGIYNYRELFRIIKLEYIFLEINSRLLVDCLFSCTIINYIYKGNIYWIDINCIALDSNIFS